MSGIPTILFSILILFFIIIWHPPFNKETLHVYSKLIRLNKEIRNVQNGGCGYFCLYMSDYFDVSNINYQIVSLKNDEVIPKHIMIKTPWGYLDNKGFFSSLSISLWSKNDIKEISKSELKQLLLLEGWNKSFDKVDTTKMKIILN
jgi:hypothetical protein